MKAVFDFLRAALPWIAMGLLFAVFFARGAKKEGRTNRRLWDRGYVPWAAIGTSFGNNTGIGLSLGMLIGLAIGTCIKEGNHNEDNDEK